jgi:ribosomal protein S12 methylthiotransferase accessory factor
MGICYRDMEDYAMGAGSTRKGRGLRRGTYGHPQPEGVLQLQAATLRSGHRLLPAGTGPGPCSAIDHANLAVNYRALGDTARAIEHFETALAMDPSIDFARTGLAALKSSDE